jgi:hypothetical protein
MHQMKPIRTGTVLAVLGTLVAAGALAAGASSRHGVPLEGGAGSGAALDAPPAAATAGSLAGTRFLGVAPEAAGPAAANGGSYCARGPARVSDMQRAPGGYPKFLRSGSQFDHSFYFTRAMYTDNGWRRGGNLLGDGGPAWSIDYPDADRHMVLVAKRLSNLDACEWENPISLADPDLRRFPFLYSLEWGWAQLTDAEVEGLRDYLLAGGLLMLDDFWGSREWAIFEWNIGRVLPGYPIVEIPRDHLLFRSYYTIDGEILQVPNVGQGRAVGMGLPGARTWEQDGYEASVRGIFDDAGRLMVVINWNTDLGDALEWAEDHRYPLQFSRFASELFMNTIIYSMTQ